MCAQNHRHLGAQNHTAQNSQNSPAATLLAAGRPTSCMRPRQHCRQHGLRLLALSLVAIIFSSPFSTAHTAAGSTAGDRWADGGSTVYGGSTVHGGSTVVHGESTAVQGGSTAVQGGSTAVHAGSRAIHGDSTAVNGGSTAVRGSDCEKQKGMGPFSSNIQSTEAGANSQGASYNGHLRLSRHVVPDTAYSLPDVPAHMGHMSHAMSSAVSRSLKTLRDLGRFVGVKVIHVLPSLQAGTDVFPGLQAGKDGLPGLQSGNDAKEEDISLVDKLLTKGPKVKEEPPQCLWVAAVLDPNKDEPGTIGWRLARADRSRGDSSRMLFERGVGDYSRAAIQANGGQRGFCYRIVIPKDLTVANVSDQDVSVQLANMTLDHTLEFELLSDDNTNWESRNAYVAIMEPGCSKFQFIDSYAMRFKKDTADTVTYKVIPASAQTWPCAITDLDAVSEKVQEQTSGRTFSTASNEAERTAAPAANNNTFGTPGFDGVFNGSVPAEFGAFKGFTCPAPPVVNISAGQGPDLIAIDDLLKDKDQFFVEYRCWQQRVAVPFDPFDPFNPRYQSYCEAVEGKIPFGCHYVLRFSAAIANIGSQDLFLGDPIATAKVNKGLFTYAPCHRHWHWDGFAKYELVDREKNITRAASKAGFCAIDAADLPAKYNLGQYRSSSGAPVVGRDWRGTDGRYSSCGEFNMTGCQGVSVGKMDVYDFSIAGQFFCLDCAGARVQFDRNYTIRITANPPFPEVPGQPCPAKDSLGFCHRFPELDYSNNVMEFTFNLSRSLIRKPSPLDGDPGQPNVLSPSPPPPSPPPPSPPPPLPQAPRNPRPGQWFDCRPRGTPVRDWFRHNGRRCPCRSCRYRLVEQVWTLSCTCLNRYIGA